MTKFKSTAAAKVLKGVSSSYSLLNWSYHGIARAFRALGAKHGPYNLSVLVKRNNKIIPGHWGLADG